MKKLFKKKWFKIVFIILIVALVGVSALLIINKNKSSSTTQEFTYTRTVTLGYGTLDETIVADGTIESQNTSTITSSVSNATISKINYSVGDYVKEGDTIIELDTTNISKQISKESESVSDKEEQLLDSYNNAQDNYDSIESQYNTAKTAKNTAYDAYKAAADIVEPYQTTYDNLVNNQNALVTYYMQQTKPGTSAKYTSEEIEASTTLTYPSTNGYTYSEYTELINAAKTELDTIKSSTNYEKLKSAYDEAYSTYSKLKSSLSSAEDSLDDAYEKYTDGVDTDTLDELYDTASDYKLKAKSDGQITSINAVLGSSASGTLATIQDTSKLKISLTIDEYDILKLELGMKCKIETDASDNVYEGEVSVISPVASTSMGSSGFEIEVNVTSEDVSDLLIGMNAEVTIILSSTEENFTVPMDAVETKSDGTQVIYVQDDNGDFYEVEVTTGDNNGYYVEVFGDDLVKGMIVRASADASEAEVTVTEDEASENLFDMFSMGGGGDMPSGGGSMPSGGTPSGGFQGGPNGN